MNKKLFAASVFSWAALLLGSSAAAEAYAITMQAGASYASCSGVYHNAYREFSCNGVIGSGGGGSGAGASYSYMGNYTQTIKFVSTSCNNGACAPPSDTVYVDSVYGTGRKTVGMTYVTCDLYYGIYTMGTCAC
jgi:hypothetical protein